jgi:hypothetical protein
LRGQSPRSKLIRDAEPIAKLVRIVKRAKPRKRLDPSAHARWQRKIAGGKVSRRGGRALTDAREARFTAKAPGPQ